MFCGGIDLMSQHVDLTCVSQTWQSNSILSCTTCTNLVAPLTVDWSAKPGLNHEHVCSLFSRGSQQQWTRHTRVRPRSRHVRLNCLLISINLSAGKNFLCDEHVAHSVFSHGCVVQNIGFDSFIDDLSSVDRSVVGGSAYR